MIGLLVINDHVVFYKRMFMQVNDLIIKSKRFKWMFIFFILNDSFTICRHMFLFNKCNIEKYWNVYNSLSCWISLSISFDSSIYLNLVFADHEIMSKIVKPHKFVFILEQLIFFVIVLNLLLHLYFFSNQNFLWFYTDH